MARATQILIYSTAASCTRRCHQTLSPFACTHSFWCYHDAGAGLPQSRHRVDILETHHQALPKGWEVQVFKPAMERHGFRFMFASGELAVWCSSRRYLSLRDTPVRGSLPLCFGAASNGFVREQLVHELADAPEADDMQSTQG